LSAHEITVHKAIELCDLSCPHLLIAVIESIKTIEPGKVIQIRATDLNAPSSIASWARQSGNSLLDMYEENGCFVFLLQRSSQDFVQFSEQQKTEKFSMES
jgi:TusA-related sulfurtransferase